LSPGAIEIIIWVVAALVAIVAGRYYTYNHPMARQMQAEREAALNDSELQAHVAAGRRQEAIARYVALTGLSPNEAERMLEETLF
jgi:methyl coenzyme M reductase subunit C